MKSLKRVELTFRGSTALLAMTHPPANTLSAEMSSEIEAATVEAENDPRTRVIVVTSALSTIFMAGGDIREMRRMIEEKDVKSFAHFIDASQSAFRRLSRVPVPVIAAIDGHAMGGGAELALSCDFRFMKDGKWQFGLTEARHGIFPAAGGTQLLSRLIGPGRAFDMLLRGTSVDAISAAQMGLIDRVVSDGTALDAALAWADDLASAPKQAIAGIKRSLFGGLAEGLDKGYQLEKEEILRVIQTQDAREGLNAFLEKRRPAFQGR